ncbi:XrtA/PEP-CTERM system TPR-repeat protein PrsT [Eilatimonas milleporae]|uniref:Putative PEP-CTERM system TPR-repeat lipoprotein n=1 Tax=Eilatimonas milleporae TaxID=911205 RepID=A0A3M0CQ65_9PROT|nr:XrtA/PEP-CTERM system TPR-repeat protein PrsT [Eilatimonas milleporae]RMB08926.1 putative PEP-CTERM system TPR-repeat lipoprotein [Eilatimonas milleporae]
MTVPDLQQSGFKTRSMVDATSPRPSSGSRVRVLSAGFLILIGTLGTAPLALGQETAGNPSQAGLPTLELAEAALQDRRPADALDILSAMVDRDEASVPLYLLMARAYLESGAGVTAEAAIGRARDLGADYAATSVMLAKAYLMQGRALEALGALRGVSIPESQRTEALVVQGDAHFAGRQLQDAQRYYALARDAAPEDHRAYLGLARLALQARDYDKAATLAQEAARLSPDSSMVVYTQGLISRYQGRPDDARVAFERAAALFPGNILAQLELAALKIAAGQDDAAENHLDIVYASAPGHPIAQYLNAVLLARRGDYTGAEALLLRTRTLVDRYLPALYVFGFVSYATGKDTAAERALSRVLAARPDNREARLTLAASLIRQGRPGQARQILAPLLTVEDRRDPLAAALSATAAIAVGDVAEGEELLADIADTDIAADAVNGSVLLEGLTRKLALVRFVADGADAGLSTLANSMRSSEGDVRGLSLLASMQIRSGALDAAAETARRLLAVAPERALGHNLLGTVRYVQGDFQASLESFDTALSRRDDYHTARRNRALARFALGDLDGAVRDLETLLDAVPGDIRAKALLGRSLFALDRAEEAVEYFREVVRARPADAEVRVDYADALSRAGRTLVARDQASRAVSMASDRPELLARLGAIMMDVGDPARGARILSRYVAYRPDDPAANELHGRALLAAGLTTGARFSFTRAYERAGQEDRQRLNWYLFAADARGGRLDEALRRYPDLRIAARPDDVSQAVLGDAFLTSGRPTDAVAAYRRAEEAGERNPELALGLSRALEATGDHQTAVRVLRDALDDMPGVRRLRLALSEIYRRQGDPQSAARQLEEILAAGLADANVSARLAEVYLDLGRKESVIYAERARTLMPDDPYVLNVYGWVKLQAERDVGEAVAALAAAARRAPAQARYKYHYAMALVARGDREGARRQLEKALSLDPDFDGADAARSQLEQLM